MGSNSFGFVISILVILAPKKAKRNEFLDPKIVAADVKNAPKALSIYPPHLGLRVILTSVIGSVFHYLTNNEPRTFREQTKLCRKCRFCKNYICLMTQQLNNFV